jgi:hypothetical protein
MNGSLYLASNPEMSGVYKIGWIGPDRKIETRMRELSAPTGVAGRFVHHWVEKTANARLAERVAHVLLADFRVPHTREFFRCDIRIACMGMLIGAHTADGKIAPDDAVAEFERGLIPSSAVLAWRAQSIRRQAA